MMIKQVATVAGAGLAVAFLVVFFLAKPDSMDLVDVAPRVGMSHDELLALGPRIASHTGATLGTSRRVVYLLACSGMVNRQTLEEQATQASAKALKERLSDREAVVAVLSGRVAGGGAPNLKGC
jgi:hypothetical protein